MDYSRTALHFAVKKSKVEITRILLENGARDEWGDLFGTYAREYIRDDNLDNITNKEKLQPAQRGKAISTKANNRKTQTTAILTNLHQVHLELFHLKSAQNSNFAYHQQQLLMNTGQVLQNLKDLV